MPELVEEKLRALIQLLAPVAALRDDLTASLHTGLSEGTGDFAVRTVNGLQAAIAATVDDPYIQVLRLEPGESVKDREKASMAALAAGQLLAYLQGKLGLPQLGKGGGLTIQKGILYCNDIALSGLADDTMSRVLGDDSEHEE